MFGKQIGKVSYCDLWEVEREDVKAEITKSMETASKVAKINTDRVHSICFPTPFHSHFLSLCTPFPAWNLPYAQPTSIGPGAP